MSMQDPISDMLTAVRNANIARHETASFPTSRIKNDILRILQEEGYIKRFENVEVAGKPRTVVVLKYTENEQPVISGIERVSKPSLRQYFGHSDIPRVRSGMGHAILTTSEGIMTDNMARRKKLGGELICKVW